MRNKFDMQLERLNRKMVRLMRRNLSRRQMKRLTS